MMDSTKLYEKIWFLIFLVLLIIENGFYFNTCCKKHWYASKDY
jgi:hypothetical protein